MSVSARGQSEGQCAASAGCVWPSTRGGYGNRGRGRLVSDGNARGGFDPSWSIGGQASAITSKRPRIMRVPSKGISMSLRRSSSSAFFCRHRGRCVRPACGSPVHGRELGLHNGSCGLRRRAGSTSRQSPGDDRTRGNATADVWPAGCRVRRVHQFIYRSSLLNARKTSMYSGAARSDRPHALDSSCH
jgi:hypothetical protein